VTIGSTSRTGVDLVLPDGLGITGTVRGPDDQPIAGAFVSANAGGGITPASSGGDITAADGTFRLAGVGSGGYTIFVGFDIGSPHLQGYYDAADPDHFTTDFSQATIIPLDHEAVGSSYVPIAPTRVADSRNGTGGVGLFHTGVPQTFQVTGQYGIPDGAVAVTGNVAIVGQTGAGYLAVTPTPTANPTSSTINLPLGDIRANNFTVPLSGTGGLSAVWKGPGGSTAHVIVDITGYFVADASKATYTPIAPVRVMDTRPTSHVGPISTLIANEPETLSVADTNGIPADAVAITGNLAVVGQTMAGYVSITKDPTASPTTSTINVPVGDIRANGVSAPLNAGALSIVYKASSGSANVILDVTGYYRNDPSGLLYYPVRPGRVMDTRPGIPATGLTGQFTSSAPRELIVAGRALVPLSAAAVTGNLTVTGQTTPGYVAITPASTAAPSTATINFPLGDNRGNGVTVPLNDDGGLWAVFKGGSGAKVNLILDITGYFQ
jgi:hypothetical protein